MRDAITTHRRRSAARRFGLVLASALVCAPFAASSPAWAQDLAAAGQHFDAAQEAFAAGQFERAAREYQTAFDITRESSLLENIGESWQRAGQLQKAVAAYRAYLLALPQAANRAAIEERVSSIETALKEQTAQAAQAGQTAQTGQTAQAAQAGQTAQTGQTAQAAQAGQTAQTGQTAQAGQTGQTGQTAQTGQAGTAVDGAGAVAGPPITPPEPAPSKLRVAGWVSVASAVALITGGAVLGLGAQSRADEIRRRTTLLVADRPLTYTEAEREAYTTLFAEGRSYNQAAIVLFSVGGVAAATAISLFVVDYVRKPKAGQAKPTALVPVWGPGVWGLSLVREF